MGSGKPQMLAQQLHKQRTQIDIGGDRFTVHGEGYGRHKRLQLLKSSFLRAAYGRYPHTPAKSTRFRADFEFGMRLM